MLLLVCKTCHEKDRDATGCVETTAQHLEKTPIYGNKCDICGRHNTAVICKGYLTNQKKLEAV